MLIKRKTLVALSLRAGFFLVVQFNNLGPPLRGFLPDEETPPHRSLDFQPTDHGFSVPTILLEARHRRVYERVWETVIGDVIMASHAEDAEQVLHILVLEHLVALHTDLLLREKVLDYPFSVL